MKAMSELDWQSLVRDTDRGAAGGKERLFSALYGELHRLAERELKRNSGAMISPTTLLHESFLRFSAGAGQFPDKARFIGYASRVMRGLLIDLLREGRALKRGARLHITQHGNDGPDFWPRDRKLQPPAAEHVLPLKTVTIARRLKEAGYATGFFGKWHLSGDDSPKDRTASGPAPPAPTATVPSAPPGY